MAGLARLRWGTAALFGLAFASWVIALGGLGATNWLVCSDYNNTLNDIYTNFETNYNMTVTPKLQLYFNQHIQLPINGTAATSDVALCARSYRWEWFTLFFEFCVIGSGLVATVLGTRLVHARFPLANLLSIATVLIMLAVNENITDVWFFWDQHKMFNEWAGVLQKFYYSAAALVAGWILVIIFNLIWIGFALDVEIVKKPAKDANAPITSV